MAPAPQRPADRPASRVRDGRRQPESTADPAASRRLLWALALALVGIFLLVVLAAGVATPRQMAPLIVQAYALVIASGLYWGFFPSLDSISWLIGCTGVTAVAVGLEPGEDGLMPAVGPWCSTTSSTGIGSRVDLATWTSAP